MKRKEQRTMDILSTMNQQQTQQFMAANLLAIAIVMKKAGVTEMEISPSDYALLEQGETLEPIPTVEGGMIYRFEKAPLPLAKLEVPAFAKEPVTTTETTFESAWTPGRKTNAEGYYWANEKGETAITKVLFESGVWYQLEVDGQRGQILNRAPFQVRRLADQEQARQKEADA